MDRKSANSFGFSRNSNLQLFYRLVKNTVVTMKHDALFLENLDQDIALYNP